MHDANSGGPVAPGPSALLDPVPPHHEPGDRAPATPPPARRVLDCLGLIGLWRHPDFVRFWAAQSVSAIGSQLSLVALPLLAALTLDASAGQMGVLAAAAGAPFLLFGLLAGVWVDRLRRRPLLVAADLGRAAVLAAVPLAALLDALSIELLWAVAFVVGGLTVVFDVAYLAYLPTLVRRDQLLEGNAKLQASASVGQVAGPGLAGALVGLLTAPAAILIDALSYLASALFLGRIRAPEAAPAPAAGRHLRREIGEGLGAVRRDRVLRALAACSATTNLFGFAFLAIYVLYMTRELGLGATGVGLVFALGGVGALAGAVLAGPIARRLGVGRATIGAQALFGLFGLTIPLAVLVPAIALPMVAAAEFLQWLALLVYDVNAVSLRQARAPARLHGRVNATMRFLISGMQPVGSLLGGLLGGWLGLAPTLVLTSVGMMLGVLWLLASPLRTLHDLPAPDEG
jgi:MFS family permease